ncbi:MAG: UDP-3-O-acyl-N-acetylglucosamine deacetylase [bacterium]|nr:UDP-3-O-acyl-N-acetylglucosamine deacetylase [bacterium]
MSQATIARHVEVEGVGLHSGQPACVRLEPVIGSGRTMGRTDGVVFPVHVHAVRDGARATRLGVDDWDGADVSTVEHLLAALSALEIDHVFIGVEGGEVPALDGSAAPFVELIRSAGREGAPSERLSHQPVVLDEPIEVRDGDRFVRAEPADHFGFRYAIDFDHPAIGRQEIVIDRLTPERFAEEIAPARTFGFLKDLDALRSEGLAGGASLENTLVFDDSGVVNEGPLRFPDECVRHKAIDLIGDLALLDAPLQAFVTANKAGHRLHHRLVREIEARR